MRKINDTYLQIRDSVLEACKDYTTAGIFAHIENRMRLSEKNTKFYDNKRGAFYVVFNQEELAEKVFTSVRTITTKLEQLAKLGLIIKEKTWSANKIFINWSSELLDGPEKKDAEYTNNINVSANFAFGITQLLQSINNDSINAFNNTLDTLDTKSASSDSYESNDNSLKQNQPNQKDDINNMRQERKNRFDALSNSLARSLPTNTLKVLKTLSFGDPERLYKFTGYLFGAKKIAFGNDDSYYSRIENNQYIEQELPAQLNQIITYATDGKHNVDSEKNYVLSSLVNFFNEFKPAKTVDTPSAGLTMSIPEVNLGEFGIA